MRTEIAVSAIISCFFMFFATAILFFVSPQYVSAALPAGFEVETIASGLNLPGSMAFTKDGRIFVGEKSGSIRVIKNGALLPTPLIQLTDVNAYADRGLLSIALDPNFETNGYLYVLYTYENTPGTDYSGEKTGRLARVKVVGDTADESTKVIILGSVGGNLTTPSCENYAVTADCIPSDSPSHSVGGMRFGTDGKLYVTLGDGAHFQYVDPRSLRAQNLDSLAGKVLRINTDGTGPADNPFYTGNPNDNRSKVYAYGFRNAFRLDFRPSNGSLFTGDVGWNTWEEVDKVVRGGNYGWPCREGNFQTTGQNCTVTSPIDPVYVYGHDINGAGSIVAGAFATAYPASYANAYFIGDYAQNWIKIVTLDANDNFVSVQDFMTGADGAMGPVSLERGPDGNIYYIAIYTGEIRRILYTTGNRQPNAVIGANPSNGLAPLTINFSAVGSTDPDGDTLTYSWNFGDGSTGTGISATHTYTTNGTYTAVLTVTDGKGGLNTKSTTISVGNRAPTAMISAPLTGSLYTTGSTINLSGYGADPEDGSITAANKLTWTIILHHNTHIHILQTLTGTNPSFTAPDHAGASDVYTEIQLTTTDSGGLTNTKSINIYLDNNIVTGGNLIQNPSLEDPTPAAPDIPQYWFKGGYGINDAVLQYPVPGIDGVDAGKATMLSYTDGDVKWFHDSVSVDPSTTYTFTGYYKSTVPVRVITQIGYGNGTYTYMVLGAALPSTPNWTRVDRTFTTPLGAQTAVVAIPIDQVGELTIDNFSLITGTSTPVDTTPPSVSLTTPASNASVSGTVTISANAADTNGISEVQFLVDGTAINSDTTSPYSISWNSLLVTNGNHTLTAIARDTAGNTATAIPITVQVNNQVATTSPNRILNPSVETSVGTSATPQDWLSGKWGTNTTVFSYPVTGFDGTKAMQVRMTAYTSGDAKWYFKDVPLISGTQFTYASYYQSNVVTSLVARYTLTNGTFRYITLNPSVPVSAIWKQHTYTVTPPVDAVSVTMFHILSAVGTLTTDLFSISYPGAVDTVPPSVTLTSPTNNQTVTGTITITSSASDQSGVAGVQFYLDNQPLGSEDVLAPYSTTLDTTTLSNGTHTLFALGRDSVGNKASTTPITIDIQNTSVPPTQNLISNGSFETVVATNPQGWNRGGWGTNTVSYDYPIIGRDGNKAARITVTAYTDGDVKWQPDAIPMQKGKVYTFSSWYKSNTISDVIGRYTFADGSYHYFGVIKEIQPVANWTFFSASFIPPDNAVSFTPLHLISSVGYLETDDVSLTITGSGTSTNDTTAPVVQIVSPAANATVQGTINIVASSTDNIGVTYVMFAINGTPVTGNEITTSPYTYVWDTRTVSNGTYTLKATTHDAAGNNSTNSISVTVNNSTTPDTTPPTVVLTAPGADATISGAITLTADANDAIGILDVRFSIDNTLVHTDAIAPYSYSWDSTLVADGSHTITVTARDTSGNSTTATPITVTVKNTVPPVPSTNLIQNASLETGGTNDPTSWSQGNWGTNTTVFSYPVSGQSGNAAQITMTEYTDGDAKWFFNPVPVTAEASYTYSNYYRSTTESTLTARYTMSNGTFMYVDLDTIPGVGAWTKYEKSILMPTGATAFTVFHHIHSVGDLTVDEYSLIRN